MEPITSKSLQINIDNYSGPLDVLLDLAKVQKVDLANISITQLADQFIEFINFLFPIFLLLGRFLCKYLSFGYLL